jgi:hypothetical protein
MGKDQSLLEGEETEKYRGANEQDKIDQQYGINKDLKKRVFMVIKAPRG